MWCVACKESPPAGMHQARIVGTTSLRRVTVLEYRNSGLHAVAMALGERNGASTTVVGSLAQPVHNAIFVLFYLAYRAAKRCGPFTDLGRDAMTAHWWVGPWHLRTTAQGWPKISCT